MLLAHEDADHADGCFAQAERFDPNEPRWPYYRGLTRHMENPEEALPFLRRAVELCDKYDHGNVAPRLTLAETLRKTGADAEAEDQLQRILALDPANPRTTSISASWRGNARTTQPRRRTCLRPPKAPTPGRSRIRRWRRSTTARGRRPRPPRTAGAAAPPEDRPWDDRYVGEYEEMEVGRRGRFVEAEQLDAAGRLPDALPILLDLAKDASDARARSRLGRR